MKVFTMIILLILSITLNGFAPAAARTGGYGYVEEGVTAYLCSEPDERKSLFAVPQTYCVSIISEQDGWYYVKYADDDGAYSAVYGYIRKNNLTLSDVNGDYLKMTVELRFSADKIDGMQSVPDVVMTAAFYGLYEIGGTTCSYLYCNGAFGYYPKVYEYERKSTPTTAPIGEQNTDDDGPRIITAVVLAVLAVLAVAVIYFTGRRKRPDQPQSDA